MPAMSSEKPPPEGTKVAAKTIRARSPSASPPTASATAKPRRSNMARTAAT